MRKFLSIVGGVLFFVEIANFTVFWIVGVSIGGDAIGGKVERGHYYLASHGRLKEVPPWVWHYSRYHAMSVWITHPLGILGGGCLMSLNKRQSLLRGSK